MADFEVWPGPMEGVGRSGFVRAADMLDLVPRWMTPFVRISGGSPALSKLVSGMSCYLESGKPVTVQLMGNDPDLMGKTAAELLKINSVDGINLNVGCPSSRVVGHHAGGALLRYPEKISAFCCRMAEYIPPDKFSVKIRSGFASPEDMEIFLPQIAADRAVSKIFFHYRTVKENYSPDVIAEREERISRAVSLCGDIPVIANGDISSVEDACRLVKKTGACGVMIARPWLKDPFLLRRFEKDDTDEGEGRSRFFEALKKCGVSGGALIGMARMMWGVQSVQFRNVLDQLQ